MRAFLNELRRRNVLRVALAYLAGTWLIIQVLETVFPIFDLPDIVIRWVIIALAVLFVPVLGFTWAFQWSDHRLQRQQDLDRSAETTPRDHRRFDRAVIVVLSLAVLYFSLDKFLLRQPGPAQAAPETLAVMPFLDLTATQDARYFADGFAEDLLNLLARNPGLRVAGRRSSFSLRDAQNPTQEVAHQLNVSHVLEGSVRDVGQQVQISVQLASGANGYQLWSGDFDRPIAEIGKVKNEIISAVADALGASDGDKPLRTTSANAEAYVLTLRANYLSEGGTGAGRREATRLYLEALEKDPRNALAWGNLAATYINQTQHGDLPWEDGYNKSREAALNAVSIDPGLAVGHKALSFIARLFEGDLPAAIAHMERALEAAPYEITVLEDAGTLLLNIGRLDEATRVQEYCSERSPLDPISFWNLGLRYRYAGQLQESQRAFQRVRQLNPGYSGLDYHEGETLLLIGRYEEALARFETEPDEAYRLKGIALARHALGQSDASDTAFAQLIERYGDQWPSEIAHVHAYRGDVDQAFTWLDQEFESYGPGGWGEWQLQRLYDTLRHDPRWLTFLRRTGTAPEQLAPLKLAVPLEAI